jgi:squalene-hopene/tetraprenyl-beta-curcumene cyclase
MIALSALLLALPCPALANPGAPPSPALERQDGARVDLPSEIRASVRWLRGAQDAETGAYGGVEGTAWALLALTGCPDAYRASDGPFVRRALEYLVARQDEAGPIADAGVDDAQRRAQTSLAAAALLPLAGDQAGPARDAVGKALAWLGRNGGQAGPGWDAGEPLGAERAHALVQQVLARRNGDASFRGASDGTRPEVATARAIVDLSRAHAALSAGQSGGGAAPTVQALPEWTAAQHADVVASMRRGARFLAAAADEEGRYGAPGDPNPGITAMVLAALQTLPEPRGDDVQKTIDAGVAWLLSLQNDDGSIHDGRLANYTTSAAVLAFARGGRPEHREALLRARDFLVSIQQDEDYGYDAESDYHYGGIGYGSSERPDLSNLQMALEALHASGLDQDDATYAHARRFLSRTQNRSESNDVEIPGGEGTIRSGDDGGAGYLPGDSKAGFVTLEDGTRVPRSYGSMTYALLKCFVFTGLPKDDPRVVAAYDWCRRNYTLDTNPGFVATADPTVAYQGLFYYFYTMARALAVFGEPTLVDGAGVAHDWRAELCGRLLAMQDRTDGSWLNPNSPRWYEGNPILATAYALLALDAALPPASGTPGQ